MWYALTARSTKLSRKDQKKEFLTKELEIFLSAETKELLEKKIQETISNFPKQSERYLKAGLKIVEADNPEHAKQLAKTKNEFIEKDGQIGFF